ncbi:MAG: hypothetical protein JSR91_11440 [Proteobacteria bacterium]|nr:hypothetical protein [Pseudomonadota bacterium]
MSDDTEQSGRTNERSSIEFPYGDLEGAVRVAHAVFHSFGETCTHDQLAGALQLVANTGGYRARIAPARTFGLLDAERGGVRVTELGRRILDPQTEKSAKIDAFMRVPLYAALYDRYKGGLLPGASGIENAMAELGVSKKQTERARQVFERSAMQAGFFGFGRDRLVMPVRANEAEAAERQAEPSAQPVASTAPVQSTMHPFISGLLQTLPAPETEWAVRDRAKWLQTAANIFSLIYRGDGQINVTAQE